MARGWAGLGTKESARGVVHPSRPVHVSSEEMTSVGYGSDKTEQLEMPHAKQRPRRELERKEEDEVHEQDRNMMQKGLSSTLRSTKHGFHDIQSSWLWRQNPKRQNPKIILCQSHLTGDGPESQSNVCQCPCIQNSRFPLSCPSRHH